jgi:hypothetical protein
VTLRGQLVALAALLEQALRCCGRRIGANAVAGRGNCRARGAHDEPDVQELAECGARWLRLVARHLLWEAAQLVGGGADMMDRRRFLLTSVAGALTTPLLAEAEQAGRLHRIGLVFSALPPTFPNQWPFYERMRELGWAGALAAPLAATASAQEYKAQRRRSLEQATWGPAALRATDSDTEGHARGDPIPPTRSKSEPWWRRRSGNRRILPPNASVDDRGRACPVGPAVLERGYEGYVAKNEASSYQTKRHAASAQEVKRP